MAKAPLLEDQYLVYKTTHLPSGQFYIGRHVTKNLNDGYLGSGTIISQLINAHPYSEFSREILHLALSGEEMLDLEDARILEVFNHPLCLNCVLGDPNTRGVIRHSEASKKRMSIARLGKSHTFESRERIAIAHRGKKLSIESRKKISDFRKTTRMSEATKQQISAKTKGRKVNESALKNMCESFTLERRMQISKRHQGSGNPRSLSWVIHFSDGNPSTEVESLKTWCSENEVKYTSLLATQRSVKPYKNMKVERHG
jgi:DNA-binding Xre family transcriptional regulator